MKVEKLSIKRFGRWVMKECLAMVEFSVMLLQ